jgi:hypothetical protein
MTMADVILLKHAQSGIVKKGYVGFSWTTLFFGLFPALFRADFATFIGGFVIWIILAVFSYGILAIIASIVWAFVYNSYYTKKLLERGYEFADSPDRIAYARQRLGVG